MAGFVQEVRPIAECVSHVAEALSFPWLVRGKKVPVEEAAMMRSLSRVLSTEAHPAFTRSLRDGYALRHDDTTGASAGAPVFLRLAGEIAMGEDPRFELGREELAAIPTGAMMPEGADAVVMIEDTARAGDWIEIRKAVQRGENLLFKGEDVAGGDALLARGELIDCAVSGLLSAMGVSAVDAVDIKIGILSTGDEILPAAATHVPAGYIRDANMSMLIALLKRYGFSSHSYGIVPDCYDTMESRVRRALEECDALILSGGSSVGVRDHCSRIMESLPPPGLLVRGINMIPGKPTLIGASEKERKVIFGLPGHPLSCLAACVFVVLPVLLRMLGAENDNVGRFLNLPLGDDVAGRTGPDEFTPMRLRDGAAIPLAAKSGYVSAMRRADGFIILPSNQETLRRGEEAQVWIW